VTVTVKPCTPWALIAFASFVPNVEAVSAAMALEIEVAVTPDPTPEVGILAGSVMV
jgi:hypothetical protein